MASRCNLDEPACTSRRCRETVTRNFEVCLAQKVCDEHAQFLGEFWHRLLSHRVLPCLVAWYGVGILRDIVHLAEHAVRIKRRHNTRLPPIDLLVADLLNAPTGTLLRNPDFTHAVLVKYTHGEATYCITIAHLCIEAWSARNPDVKMALDLFDGCIRQREVAGESRFTEDGFGICVRTPGTSNDRDRRCMDVPIHGDTQTEERQYSELQRENAKNELQFGGNLFRPVGNRSPVFAGFAAGISGHTHELGVLVRLAFDDPVGGAMQSVVALSALAWLLPYYHHNFVEIVLASTVHWNRDCPGRRRIMAAMDVLLESDDKVARAAGAAAYEDACACLSEGVSYVQTWFHRVATPPFLPPTQSLLGTVHSMRGEASVERAFGFGECE